MRRPRAVTLVSTTVLAAGVCVAAGGCSGSCRPASIDVDTVAASAATAPTVITAHLRAGGEGIGDAELTFIVDGAGVGPETVRMGYATTDDDGTARFRAKNGLRAYLAPRNHPTKIRVKSSLGAGDGSNCTAEGSTAPGTER